MTLSPYLQRKAELEDKQRTQHELHGGEQHLAHHELDRECEILQVADDAGSRVLSVRGSGNGVCEMPERNSGKFLKTIGGGRSELVGDECARELDSEPSM